MLETIRNGMRVVDRRNVGVERCNWQINALGFRDKRGIAIVILGCKSTRRFRLRRDVGAYSRLVGAAKRRRMERASARCVHLQ